MTRNGDPERKSNIVEWALGPYPTDLLLYPTACAALPTSSSERAGNNVALLRLALLKWAFLRLQGRMEQRLLDFAPDAIVATQSGSIDGIINAGPARPEARHRRPRLGRSSGHGPKTSFGTA
jgi:hypothetical protein